MLKKKKQRKFLEKRRHAIRSYLADFAASSDPEALHQLRVEIKKLRAFARFATPGAGEAVEALRKMFRKAGQIREAGLNLLLMKKYALANAALETRQTSLMREKSRSFRAYTAYYSGQAEKAVAMLTRKLKPLPNRRIKSWFKPQLRKTAALLAAPFPDKLHNARKKIKMLLYVHGLAPGRLPLNTDYLQALQEQIGNWHDVAVATALVTREKDRGRLQRAQQLEEWRIGETAGNFMQKVSERDD
ncbi:CHAD domain-containing protein [Chitinophaga alhagiae]|nr:CHAD domain-containing protein [Chitinophaga alhagiae]